MSSSGEKKAFDEAMDEYYNHFDDPQRALKALKQAAKAAKTDKEKLVINACWLELKRRYNL